MSTNAKRRSRLVLDRAATAFAALTVIGLAVFLLVRNEPISDPKLFFALRLVLSFSTATLGAMIPGFLNLRWSGSGLAIRAGGALALFVLTFVYTPNLMTSQTIIQSPTGPLSPAIMENSGSIVIQGNVAK